MKTSASKIFLLVIAISLFLEVYAQRFDSVLKKLNTEYIQEKLYLQFDRSVYNPGETIWFKAYLFSGNFPSLISKTLYTELVDAKGKILQRTTAPVVMSSSCGSIEIPENISSTVFVRCYTKWMLNFDSSFLYTKAISIINPEKTTGKFISTSQTQTGSVAAMSPQIILQFFPEGGDLIQDVESRVAFKATDNHGIPLNIKGDILDSKGKKITSFASVHDGMGTFILQPEGGEKYKAVWTQQAQAHETVLPIAKQNGIVLETNNLENQIEFKIKHPANSSVYPFVYLVAQIQQQELFRAKVNIGKTLIATGIIPIENLPAGIIQITVFSPEEKPLAERIIFANSSDYSFHTNLNVLLKDSGKRKKNTIEIDAPDTVSSNLSISISDADINSFSENDNIYSHLLLTDDIKGYVHNPAYYFSSNSDSVADYLDLVMMTNGWRRFKWEDVLTGQFPEIKYLPENYLSIEGQVKGLNKKILLGKEINGVLELKSHKKEFINIPVQPDGKFSFSGMIFYDTAKLFYQFNKDKHKIFTENNGVSFNIKSSFLQDPFHLLSVNYLLPTFTKPDTVTVLKNNEVYKEHLNKLQLEKLITLKTVVVTTTKKTKKELINEEYTSGLFRDDPAGGYSRIILPDDDPAFLASPTLLSYLQGRIAGLQVDLNNPLNAITWRGLVTSLFVDEISQQSLNISDHTKPRIVEDASYILSLPISDIAMVKIIDPPFMGAWGAGPGGAISVYLKKPSIGNQMSKGLDFISIPGYSPIREFYSPDYSLPVHSDALDYRPTLYWNPFVIFDKNNRHIVISFYNNDITKNMKVIIEGCNEDGKLTRIERLLYP